MPFLAFLARIFLLRRLFGGGSRRGYRRTGYFGRGGRQRGYGRRRSSGFGLFGPLPTCSRRTRSGGRVSVGGCCLPIPLTLGALLVTALRLFTSRR